MNPQVNECICDGQDSTDLVTSSFFFSCGVFNFASVRAFIVLQMEEGWKLSRILCHALEILGRNKDFLLLS